MPPEKPKSELIQYQIEQLQKAVDLIEDDFDLVHDLDKLIEAQAGDLATLKRIVYGAFGLILVAVVSALIKLVVS